MPCGVVPVVVISDDLDTTKSIVVHECAQGGSNLGLLRCAESAGRVRRVTVLGLILNGKL